MVTAGVGADGLPGAGAAVVGRQAIFDRDGLVAYELLFRATEPTANRPPGDAMTAEVVFGAISIGLDTLVGDRTIFLNADRGVVLGEVPVLLPPERTVIEILETIHVDESVIEGVERLRAAGYRIALDDFVWGSGHERLLPFASIVKIDLSITPVGELAGLVARCKEFDVQVLAERVTDRGDQQWLSDLGFELFQGFGYERPRIIAGRALDARSLAQLASVSRVLAAAEDFDAVEQIVRHDPALVHHMMQLASIGRAGDTRRSVSTLRQALVTAGVKRVRNWMALLLARPSVRGPGREQASLTAIQRARACEVLAGELLPADAAELAFVAGLLSALDLLFEIPVDEIVDAMEVSDELRAAVTGADTALGRLVQDAAAYQLGTAVPGSHSGIAFARFDDAFAEAFRWSHDQQRAAAASA